jgi:hypothetical protein
MATVKSSFSELPAWAKGTIAVIGVLTLVGSALLIRRGIKKLAEGKDERQEERDLNQNAQDALNQLQQQGVAPTLSDLDAQTLSTSIAALLDGGEMTGSEKLVVESILEKVNNQADWVKLQQVFGRKTIDNWGWGTGDTTYDLKGLLNDQLDSVDWTFTRYITVLKTRLSAKGITF